MTRRCSHCSNNGHNSRTCPTRGGSGAGVKLFGVRLTDGLIIKKSASMGNLSAHYHSSSSAAASPNPGSPSSDPFDEPVHVPNGYVSDDLAHASSSSNRRSEPKKGVPWTEDEHRLFLLGLQKLGKGDWRGISRNYVTSRTPTQVASHAQKYFIRQSNVTRRKRRSSLFDMVTDPPPLPEEQTILPPQPVEIDRDEGNLPPSQSVETDHLNFLPSLDLSLQPDYESMPTNSCGAMEKAEESLATSNIPYMIPSILPAYFPAPFPMWPSNVSLIVDDKGAEASDYELIKPIPVIPTQPVNVDELVGMSQLSLRENGTRHIEPSPLSLKLLGEPSRQSAFHLSAPASGSGRTKGDNSSSNSSSTVEAA